MTSDQYRICPTNKKVIEQRLPSPVYQWGFYCVKDSPADARRSLARLNGTVEQAQLWEETTHDSV
jgi:hypothetical protein